MSAQKRGPHSQELGNRADLLPEARPGWDPCHSRSAETLGTAPPLWAYFLTVKWGYKRTCLYRCVRRIL